MSGSSSNKVGVHLKCKIAAPCMVVGGRWAGPKRKGRVVRGTNLFFFTPMPPSCQNKHNNMAVNNTDSLIHACTCSLNRSKKENWQVINQAPIVLKIDSINTHKKVHHNSKHMAKKKTRAIADKLLFHNFCNNFPNSSTPADHTSWHRPHRQPVWGG